MRILYQFHSGLINRHFWNLSQVVHAIPTLSSKIIWSCSKLAFALSFSLWWSILDCYIFCLLFARRVPQNLVEMDVVSDRHIELSSFLKKEYYVKWIWGPNNTKFNQKVKILSYFCPPVNSDKLEAKWQFIFSLSLN